MSTRRSEKEQQIAAVLLITFSSLLLGMLLLEFILVGTNPLKLTLGGDFLNKSRMDYVMPLIIGYLVIGAAGFVGTLGLAAVYGPEGRLETEVVKFSALGYFLTSYWLWSAVFMVQHKITLLAEKPTDPPEWLLLGRGATLLPRVASWAFLALAVSRFLDLISVGTRGSGVVNRGGFDFAMLNDSFFMIVQIV
ncbi:MAG: hypothetical protein MUC67_06520, partial [Acidobacteria bacterium]|nr:hypothetical protein [Acidobacteriota bacterium]